jgi:hypothetical protein
MCAVYPSLHTNPACLQTYVHVPLLYLNSFHINIPQIAATIVAPCPNPYEIANPASPAFSVSEGGISTLTFIIDELSDITITALSDITEGSESYLFSDTTQIATSTQTDVAGGDLVLANTLGVYETAGTAYLSSIAPAALESWETIRVAADLDAGTDFVVQLYTGTAASGYALIPDTELAGNAIGFTDSLIDISGLDIGLYPTTTVGIRLSTTDTSVTPEIDEVVTYWRESATARPGQYPERHQRYQFRTV